MSTTLEREALAALNSAGIEARWLNTGGGCYVVEVADPSSVFPSAVRWVTESARGHLLVGWHPTGWEDDTSTFTAWRYVGDAVAYVIEELKRDGGE